MSSGTWTHAAAPEGPQTTAARAGPAPGYEALGDGMTCLAGFYASAPEAEETVRQLTALPLGVLPAQLHVIPPARSAWSRLRSGNRYRALRRKSADRPWLDNRGLMAGMAVVAGALAGACGLMLEGSSDDMSLLFLTMIVSGLGAVVAAGLALMGHQQPQYKRFNRTVRRQLAARRWVVLVQNLPPHHHDPVFALVRERSHGWCVASAARAWL